MRARGVLEHDAFDADPGSDALGGVPATVGVSLVVAVSWALSLIGGIRAAVKAAYVANIAYSAHIPSPGPPRGGR
ncbi:hypothetical protein [Streptodolium elevatio]